MIISQIIGGLGNQMFQYAVGRAVSLQKKQRFHLDVSGFAHYGLHHGFELERIFKIDGSLAASTDLAEVLGWQSDPRIRRVLARKPLAFLRRKELIFEPSLAYWPAIQKVPESCYLSGYWQSEKYFIHEARQIREDFTFRTPFSETNEELANLLSRINSVSLHIRRGDYVANPANHSIYASCSPEYYRKAANFIAERIANPQFFIFSDDMDWVRNNLNLPFPTRYIDHNRGTESFNDMRLISLCRHHIIANSSFSWWGAWLGTNLEKIVIAPEPWFASKTMASQDLIPPNWHTLPKSG